MIFNRLNKKASSIIEYAAIFVLVATALTTFYFFLKSSVSGKWKSGFDVFGYGRQYDVNNTTQTSDFLK